MTYLFSKSYVAKNGDLIVNRDYYKRWKEQMETDYQDLSEEEQDSDRKEAEKFLYLYMEFYKNFSFPLTTTYSAFLKNEEMMERLKKDR